MFRPSLALLAITATASALAACTNPASPAPPTATLQVPVAAASTAQASPTPAKPPAPAVHSVGIEDLFAMLHSPNPPLLCDARLSVLYHLGHLPGALSVPSRGIAANFARHRTTFEQARDSGRKLVFYCIDPDCPDAQIAAEWIAAQGFPGILVYEGGIREWKAAGFDLE